MVNPNYVIYKAWSKIKKETERNMAYVLYWVPPESRTKGRGLRANAGSGNKEEEKQGWK